MLHTTLQNNNILENNFAEIFHNCRLWEIFKGPSMSIVSEGMSEKCSPTDVVIYIFSNENEIYNKLKY